MWKVKLRLLILCLKFVPKTAFTFLFKRFFYIKNILKLQGAVIILKIKKSRRKAGEWIVYNPHNFELHTHCRSFRVALILRNNVERHQIPKSCDTRLIISHLRLTHNRKYRQMLEERLNEVLLKSSKTRRRIQAA